MKHLCHIALGAKCEMSEAMLNAMKYTLQKKFDMDFLLKPIKGGDATILPKLHVIETLWMEKDLEKVKRKLQEWSVFTPEALVKTCFQGCDEDREFFVMNTLLMHGNIVAWQVIHHKQPYYEDALRTIYKAVIEPLGESPVVSVLPEEFDILNHEK